MDQIKIGKFIAELRKEKNMTQQQLGDKVGVSFKAISKWENGRGMPDLSFLKPLSDNLGISVNELLSGEKNKKEKLSNSSEEELLNILKNEENYSTKKYKKYLICIMLIYAIIMSAIIFLQLKNILPGKVALIIIGIMIFTIVVPTVIIDLQKEMQLKKIYKYYQEENKILKLSDKRKYLKIILVAEIMLALIIGTYISMKYIVDMPKDEKKEIMNTLSITSNKDNIIETEYYNFDNNNWYLKIPKDFKVMKEEYIQLKYPLGNAPTAVYTNEEGTINIAVNITENPMKNSEIEFYIRTIEEQMASINGETIGTKFYQRDGHQIGEIQFVTQAVDTKIYNHTMAFSNNGYLRIVSFNCTEKYKDEWKEVGEFIINSIMFDMEEV